MWFKKKFFSIIQILIIAVLGFKLFTTSEEETYESYNKKMQDLESKIDSLHSVNDGLVSKIDTLNEEVSKLDLQIDLKNSRISNLKYRINEKVNNVDHLNNSELQKFFTNRYSQHITGGTDSTSSN